jgi:hypothetical protein
VVINEWGALLAGLTWLAHATKVAVDRQDAAASKVLVGHMTKVAAQIRAVAEEWSRLAKPEGN